MSKTIIALIIVALISTVGVYVYLSGKDHVVRIPEKQLQEKLQENLPISKSYFFIFQVTLNNPRVTLKSGSSRVNAGLDATLNIKLANEEIPLSGSLDASGGIKYEPEKGQFYLTDPVVEKLSIQGIPEKYNSKATSVIENALTDYYATHPIYTLKEGDVKQVAAKLVLKSVLVEDKELMVVLGI
jgi:hypothetical protein